MRVKRRDGRQFLLLQIARGGISRAEGVSYNMNMNINMNMNERWHQQLKKTRHARLGSQRARGECG